MFKVNYRTWVGMGSRTFPPEAITISLFSATRNFNKTRTAPKVAKTPDTHGSKHKTPCHTNSSKIIRLRRTVTHTSVLEHGNKALENEDKSWPLLPYENVHHCVYSRKDQWYSTREYWNDTLSRMATFEHRDVQIKLCDSVGNSKTKTIGCTQKSGTYLTRE